MTNFKKRDLTVTKTLDLMMKVKRERQMSRFQKYQKLALSQPNPSFGDQNQSLSKLSQKFSLVLSSVKFLLANSCPLVFPPYFSKIILFRETRKRSPKRKFWPISVEVALHFCHKKASTTGCLSTGNSYLIPNHIIKGLVLLQYLIMVLRFSITKDLDPKQRRPCRPAFFIFSHVLFFS